ncbi:hypothetical protein ACW5R3_12235 [Bizionia sp. KMM 8389]
MIDTVLTIRVEGYVKQELEDRAKKNNETVSEYVRQILKDKHFIEL